MCILPAVCQYRTGEDSFLCLKSHCLEFSGNEYAADRGEFSPQKRKSSRVIYIAMIDIAMIDNARGIVNTLMELGRLSDR